MTKYMSEEEIEKLRIDILKYYSVRVFRNTPLDEALDQAKLASSAIAEAKALRALIEGLDPIYFHDKHTLIRDLKADAKKIPLLQQGEDNGS